MAQKIRKTAFKKDKNNLVTGVVHIQSTFNNTIVTITNLAGDTISWASAGSSGFKGARKGTPFAAQTAAEKAAVDALNTGMKNVEIYTTPICGFCSAAKRLLNFKNVSFVEMNVMIDPALRMEMIQRANGSQTVPQIFIGNEHIGGCDDLHALENAGKLDEILAS